MDTSKLKNLRHWVMKTNTNEHHNRIVSDLFNALFVSAHSGHLIDYTPNSNAIMTLDICQCQSLMIQQREGDYSQTDIIEALRGLEYPKLIDKPAIQKIHIKRYFHAIRLDYGEAVPTSSNPTEQTTDLAAELSQIEIPQTFSSHGKDTKSWKAKAFELQEDLECERTMNDSLRKVIIEMSETLHEADPNARISMTSADLLELIQGRDDTTNNPF